jgi:hypothetical protein
MLYAISPYSSNWLPLNQASEKDRPDFCTRQLKAAIRYLATTKDIFEPLSPCTLFPMLSLIITQ